MANLPALTPTTFAEMLQFAELLAKSTMVPRDYQRNPANIVLAVQFGAEVGMPPLQALQSIAVISGKPAFYGDAQMALVKGSPVYEDVIETMTGSIADKTATAICDARRKGKEPVIRTFSVEDAIKAKLWGKAGPWSEYPLRMLQMRARGFALRDQFTDVLRGMISVEEARDIPRDPPKDVTPPASSAAAELDAFAAENSELASDQLDVDQLLTDAHSRAQQGFAPFRTWYHDVLDDEQRIALRPHIRGLQDTARAVGPNQGEVDMGLVAASSAASPEARDDKWTIQTKEVIAAADKLRNPVDSPPPESPRDQPAQEPGRPEGSPIRLILPTHGPKGGVNWKHYADEVIEQARTHDPMHMHEFRVRYAALLNSLQLGNKEEWERVTKELAALERGEDTEDERNLRDDDPTTMT